MHYLTTDRLTGEELWLRLCDLHLLWLDPRLCRGLPVPDEDLKSKQHRFVRQLAQFLPCVLTWAGREGHQLALGECYRTPEQAALYAPQGKGIKPSPHLDRLAIDIVLCKDGLTVQGCSVLTGARPHTEGRDRDGGHCHRSPS
jgi:hypothetical protein